MEVWEEDHWQVSIAFASSKVIDRRSFKGMLETEGGNGGGLVGMEMVCDT